MDKKSEVTPPWDKESEVTPPWDKEREVGEEQWWNRIRNFLQRSQVSYPLSNTPLSSYVMTEWTHTVASCY